MHHVDEDRRSRRGNRVRAAVAVALLVCGVVLALTVDLPDPEAIRERVDAAGAWGVLAFFGVYAVLSATPIPASVLTIASGVLFGLATGAIVVLLAAVVGAAIAYELSRALGGDVVSRIGWHRVHRLDAMLTRRGVLSVLIVRLIPVFPFWLVSYAAGLSSVGRRQYTIGTAVGIVPGTVGYTALGAYGTSPLSWPFAVAVLAVVALTVATTYAGRRLGLTAAASTETTP